ncbi:GNAT family N-acetyltransferase [Larkinella insperata]|uniref:GNAT family N-acetyltransferase n=1 Tax=Larkinella insperata TaxID=332158 RepID=A0ABW3QMN5_9BACT|nr:GNAT family N-acetyltransferase [Larkinella insperata]
MPLTYRLATEADLIGIVNLLSDDKLGTQREQFEIPLPNAYLRAFRIIAADPHQELTVVESGGELVATFQLSFIQYLTYQGGIRAQIEAVRVKSSYRGQGIGTAVFRYAIERARTKGAHVVQLTTDKKRPEAKKFYESLGFIDSHEGMKFHLN